MPPVKGVCRKSVVSVEVLVGVICDISIYNKYRNKVVYILVIVVMFADNNRPYK